MGTFKVIFCSIFQKVRIIVSQIERLGPFAAAVWDPTQYKVAAIGRYFWIPQCILGPTHVRRITFVSFHMFKSYVGHGPLKAAVWSLVHSKITVIGNFGYPVYSVYNANVELPFENPPFSDTVVSEKALTIPALSQGYHFERVAFVLHNYFRQINHHLTISWKSLCRWLNFSFKGAILY